MKTSGYLSVKDLIIILSCFFSAPIFTATAANVSATNLDSVLMVLDAEIGNVETRRNIKQQHLDALRRDLALAANPDSKFHVANELFEEYKAYQSDSAFKYAAVMHRLGTENADPTMLAVANTAFADYFISVGFFKEATEMLNLTNSTLLSPQQRHNYYNLHARLYRTLCSYVGGPEAPLWNTYNDLNRAYLDSILVTSPEHSYEYAFAKIDRDQIDHPDPAKAVEERKLLLRRHDLPDHEKAINYSLLAHSLIDGTHREEAEYYLALSAISDMARQA